jgi:beta-xylosidase
MHSYASVDGVPAAGNRALLTDLLRDRWGFGGTVVADYFGISFLQLLHGTAATLGEAASQALHAGVDVELPGPSAYLAPLLEELEAGRVDPALIDTALRRVLEQKDRLGLLDPDWDAAPPALGGAAATRGAIDLDPPADRALARRIADEAVVLLENRGILPLDAPGRIVVIGPIADDPIALLGCYSFPAHVGVHHPEIGLGVAIPTLLDGVRAAFPGSEIITAAGCDVRDPGRDGFAAALAAAADADVVIATVGDRSGLFGRGTSGEGCDAPSLRLPGEQQALLEALLDGPAPVVVVVDSGRPYALGTAPERAGAIVQTFFPGEEGAHAVAGVLAGTVNPSGRLPVSIPTEPDGQPWTYLVPQLALASEVSALDPTPRYPFGHGTSYTTFAWADGDPDADADVVEVATDGETRVSIVVRNAGERAGTEVVQLYLHDPAASVVQPVIRLIGFQRVDLDPGAAARVTFTVPADVTSFTGPDLERIVEPGEIELRLGASSADIRHARTVRLTGPGRRVDHRRRLHCDVTVEPA